MPATLENPKVQIPTEPSRATLDNPNRKADLAPPPPGESNPIGYSCADAPAILPDVPTLEQIQALERVMRQHPNQIEIKTTHHFTEGIYAREIFIPAGVLLTGKIHRTHHLNIVSAGAIEVWTEQGMKLVRAPYSFVAGPGTKRVGLAHEDTVWTTIHPNPTDERDMDKLEAVLIIPENQLTGGEPCLGLQQQ